MAVGRTGDAGLGSGVEDLSGWTHLDALLAEIEIVAGEALETLVVFGEVEAARVGAGPAETGGRVESLGLVAERDASVGDVGSLEAWRALEAICAERTCTFLARSVTGEAGG